MFNSDNTNLVGFRQKIKAIFINSAAKEGVDLLLDLRRICETHGVGSTFSYTQSYLDFESYVVFDKETILNVALALVAVFFILIIFTANLIVSCLVLLCVALVDLFLFSLLTWWDVALNSVTVVHIVVAIGLSVDYSAHIGHAFLTIDPPETDEHGNVLTDHQKRVHKARGALGQMGTSVFHGAFSTLLAIIVLAPSASYVF